jgi:short-subunit dehydrogenase
MTFENRVVLITGASKGIGRSLAIDLAARGAIVVGCARSAGPLQTIAAELRRTSPLSDVIQCDVAEPEQVTAMVTRVLRQFHKIDILINNAGIGMRQPFAETDISLIEKVMRINYLGAVYCTHEVLPSMIARGSGHIVNLSSVAGKIGALNLAGYCASKFAMNGFSESLYHELAPLGIHVSVICPGPVRTEFNRAFADTPPKSPASLVVSPEFVSAAVIRALEKRRFEVVLPRTLALLCLIKRLTPGLFRSLARRAFRSRLAGRKNPQSNR